MSDIFNDRRDAGEQLADALEHYAGDDDVIVLGLPRGGVPVAYEVAMAIHAPLDIFTVRKLGVPTHPELAMGAIATGGTCVLNQEIVDNLQIQDESIQRVEQQEREELQRREDLYRGDKADPVLKDKKVILVDDGMATGATMKAAVQALKQHEPQEIIVAVPTASRDGHNMIEPMVDEIVALQVPQHFGAVGRWFKNFGQTTDDDVRSLLSKAKERDEIPAAERA